MGYENYTRRSTTLGTVKSIMNEDGGAKGSVKNFDREIPFENSHFKPKIRHCTTWREGDV
jgi:hypothetical protein